MAEHDPVTLNQARLREQFAALALSRRRVAVTGIPEGQNCGAYANYLGTLQLLRDAAAEIAYSASWSSLDMAAVAALGRDAVVFVFGDAPATAALLRAVPNPVVLLAGTASARNADLMHVLRTSGGLTIFATSATVRDAMFQATGGKAAVSLLPPPAFMLAVPPRPNGADYDIVWLARTERKDSGAEAAARLLSQPAEKLDLPEFPDGLDIDVVVKRRPPTILLTDWSSLVFRSQEARLNCNALSPELRADAYVQRGLHILSLGRVVITDRPGAQVLCLLLRIPHVFTGDSAEAWAEDADLAHFAGTPAQAWAHARALLHDSRDE